MDELRNKVAFITGAASGIGLGIARACLEEGMRVALADVREGALNTAAAELVSAAQLDEPISAGAASTGRPGVVLPLVLDVTDRRGWITAVERVQREIGPIDLLCSNAGVNFVGATHEATYEDWEFALGVNVGGAINAIRTVVPRMIAGRRAGHIVITSSVSGLFTSGGAGVYVTSKFALVGLAESLRADLKPFGIGVSVLCPGPVQSELFESTAEVRPSRLAATGSVPIVPPGTARTATPIYETAPSGAEVGRKVLAGVRRNELYILTHAEIRPMLEARSAALLTALPEEPVDPARIAASERLLDATLYQRSPDRG